ncbi:MAG TPA: DHA2 family efflux MFS transporter permease subunit [Acetobacteraceae bacterium]|jgi:EmrB/QacA subfamily drug resistance transporter|nr:DHA2 family efflux MFS transporter permease subunit [Acetobacteraceae bacterium]
MPPLNPAAPPARLRFVMAGALLAMALAALDQNIVNTALPRMAGDLGGMAHLSWVVTAFMLTSTTTTPLYGKMSDLFGRRQMFFVAIGIFLVGSMLCGSSQSIAQLILFRALQGLGAGGLLVLAQASVADVISPRDRPRYQGLFTGTFALSSVAGPVLGGVITSALSWRWVFYVNLPVGALALVTIAFGLRNPPRAAARPIDYAGAGALAAATTALLLMLSWAGTEFAWLSAETLGLGVLTLLLAALFLFAENRAEEPIIRLALFRNLVFARGVAVGGMMSFAMLGSTVFLPLYFQLVLGMSPAVAGAMLVPQVVGMLLTSILGGRLVSRRGKNRPFLLAGIGLEAAALAALALLAYAAAPTAAFLVALGLLGLGMGMGMPNLTTAVQNAVAYREVGAATGAMTFLRSLGGALGVALSGAILAARLTAALASLHGQVDLHTLIEGGMNALGTLTPPQRADVVDGYRTALTGCFTLSGLVMTAAFILVTGLPEMTLRRSIDDARTEQAGRV